LVAERPFSMRLTPPLADPAAGRSPDTFSVTRASRAGGTATDRVSSRRKAAGLTLSGEVRLWHVFAIASVLGTINAFDIPARQSFLAELVDRTGVLLLADVANLYTAEVNFGSDPIAALDAFHDQVSQRRALDDLREAGHRID